MNDTNDIFINNEAQNNPTNEIRYANDDVPFNASRGQVNESQNVSEFGMDSSVQKSATTGHGRIFRSKDVSKIAATFAVVSIVAMAVVLDESPFEAIFDPVIGPITESFGITDDDSGYAGDCRIALDVTDTDILYVLNFSEDPGEDTYLRVTNPFTDRLIHITDEDSMSGVVENLKSGLKYTLTVEVDGEKVRSRSVTTLQSYDNVPKFTMIYAKCECLTEGKFVFKFNILDKKSVWSDFEAQLIFPDGTHFQRISLPDVTVVQEIGLTKEFVESLTNKTASLVVYCTETIDGISAEKTLYNEIVNI